MNEATETSPVPPKHPTLRRRLAIVGLTAGLLGGAAIGAAVGGPVVSGAQDDTSPAAEAPADPAVPAEDERPERGERLTAILQPLVDDGTITQAQLEAVVTTIQDAGPLGGHGPGGHHRGQHLEAVAEALGMTSDELRTALQDGATIAEVAASQGVDLQVVIDAMVAELQTHLEEKVASGELTQEQADARLAEATERITGMVNGERPAGGPGFGPGRGFGPGGPGGPGAEDAEADPED